jgi:hypothetical protein
MEGFLKQSTAVNITVLMIDSSDHVTGKTGLTLTIYATKAAGTPAAITPTVTELDSTNVKGLYKLALTTAHTDTLGEFQLHVTATGADPTDVKWQVSTYLPGEAATLQADQAVNVTKWLGTAVSTPTVAGVPNVNVKTWNDLTTVALPLVPTTAGRTLDVSATGEAGVDWANVGSPTTAVGLTGTTIATSQVVASVSGAVGSVTGAVGSVTARVTANTDQLAGQTVTAAAGVTFPTSVASPTNITAASGVALTAAYDPAKTAAQAGDAMTLTAAYDYAKGTAAMTESYAADGAAMTPVQAHYMTWSLLAERSIASTTLTAKKLDGTTSAMTFTLDDATTPTSQTRAT